MPSVKPIANDYLKSLLNGLQAQITALATTQNQHVLDNNSIVRFQVGWHQTNNSYWVTIFDPSGNRRVVLGQLPKGDHGIELIDLSGNTQELLPSRDDYAGPTLSTTSATPVGLSGSPFVNINLGASGDCEITAGALVGCAANDTANAYLVIDGGTPESIFGLGSTAASAGNVQSTRRISTWLSTTLTPNVGHSFTMATRQPAERRTSVPTTSRCSRSNRTCSRELVLLQELPDHRFARTWISTD